MSSDGDQTLRELAHMARDEAAAEAEDPRWEKLARGELTAAEEGEIRRQAGESAEIAALYEAFRPLGDETKERIVDQIVAGDAGARSSRGGKVVRLHPMRRAAIVAVPLAVAAAVALWIARPPAETGPIASVDAPVPQYALVVTGGDRATRSRDAPAPAGPFELRRDSRLELVLRPSTPVSGAVAARGFLVQGSDARSWSPTMEISSDGAIRVAGTADAFHGVPVGTWDVVLTVGRQDTLPSDPKLVAGAMREPQAPRPWQLFVTHVRLVDGS